MSFGDPQIKFYQRVMQFCICQMVLKTLFFKLFARHYVLHENRYAIGMNII